MFYLLNIEGSWYGTAADSFFNEMESEMFPSLNRLSAALKSGGDLTYKIIETLSEAERVAADQFTFGDPGSASETIPAHPDGDYGIPEREVIPSHPDSDQKPTSSKSFMDHSNKEAESINPFHEFPICSNMECVAVTIPGHAVSVEKLKLDNTVSIGSEILAMGIDIATFVLDIGELATSIIGLSGQALSTAIGSIGGPVGAILGALLVGFGADGFETGLSLITTSGDALADFLSGKTYYDFDTNEIVVGQATILGITENSVDMGIPSAPIVDVVSNVAGVYASFSSSYKDDAIQLRFPLGSPYKPNYVVHTSEFQDPVLRAIIDKINP